MEASNKSFDLNLLTAEEFANLCNSLLMEVFGPGLVPFGALGPDGGRDAILRLDYPSPYKGWSGEFVFQYKHHDTRGRLAEARNSVVTEIRREYHDLVERRGNKPPQNYILVTNVVFTGVDETGTHDRMAQAIAYLKNTHGIWLNIDYWDGAKVAALLIKYPAISRQYFKDVAEQIDRLQASLERLSALGGYNYRLVFESLEETAWRVEETFPDAEFYRGKNAQWRHILAGQDVPRPNDIARMMRLLARSTRNCIILSESGQGKTTLMFRFAYKYRKMFSVLEVKNIDFDPKDKVEFSVLALQNTHSQGANRILLLVDDICRRKGWQHFLDRVLQLPFVYVLATSRSDEWSEVGLQAVGAQLKRYAPVLDRQTANAIYDNLKTKGLVRTDVTFGRAFEQSRNRLLEFVTLLTQGSHLNSILRYQVANVQESLQKEVLCFVSVAHTLGLSLTFDNLLCLTQTSNRRDLRKALISLQGEFIQPVREDVFEGLHELRSRIIAMIIHEAIPARETLTALFSSQAEEEQLRLAERVRTIVPEWFVHVSHLATTAIISRIQSRKLDPLATMPWLKIGMSLPPEAKMQLQAVLGQCLGELRNENLVDALIHLGEISRDFVTPFLHSGSAAAFVHTYLTDPLDGKRAARFADFAAWEPGLIAEYREWMRRHLVSMTDMSEYLADKEHSTERREELLAGCWACRVLVGQESSSHLWQDDELFSFFNQLCLQSSDSDVSQFPIQALLVVQGWLEKGMVKTQLWWQVYEFVQEWIMELVSSPEFELAYGRQEQEDFLDALLTAFPSMEEELPIFSRENERELEYKQVMADYLFRGYDDSFREYDTEIVLSEEDEEDLENTGHDLCAEDDLDSCYQDRKADGDQDDAGEDSEDDYWAKMEIALSDSVEEDDDQFLEHPEENDVTRGARDAAKYVSYFLAGEDRITFLLQEFAKSPETAGLVFRFISDDFLEDLLAEGNWDIRAQDLVRILDASDSHRCEEILYRLGLDAQLLLEKAMVDDTLAVPFGRLP